MQQALASLALGILLIGGLSARAQVQPSPFGAAQAGAGQTDAGQIVAPRGAGDVNAGQISAPSHGGATAASQLTRPAPRVDSPQPLSAPGQSRNTAIAAVKGHDRCDPAAGASAESSDCARIIDNRADEFTGPANETSAPVVHSDASASSMVDDVVNGGTGSVVILPTK